MLIALDMTLERQGRARPVEAGAKETLQASASTG